MLVRWTQPAADDLLHICDYTAERFGAAQGRRVADATRGQRNERIASRNTLAAR
jgi:plasmid stabilization system protein ParE